MRVRDATRADEPTWLQMRTELWPDTGADHRNETRAYFEQASPFVDHVLVCETGDGEVVGFAELRIRNYAEGSTKTDVPFLEGWFVDDRHRGQGVGRRLIAGAEQWAKSCGYSELASNTEIHNETSIAAHLALGFQEIERTVAFLKKL
jgi:aminoglycoside 6'-N-acetyltransferase I